MTKKRITPDEARKNFDPMTKADEVIDHLYSLIERTSNKRTSITQTFDADIVPPEAMTATEEEFVKAGWQIDVDRNRGDEYVVTISW